MKRRSFLAAIFAAPAVATVAVKSISTEPEKPTAALPKTDVEKLNGLSANIGQFSAGTIRYGDRHMLIDVGRGIIRIG